MIPYASATGNRATLQMLRDRDWRLMVSAEDLRDPEGLRYAIDNGAWSAHQQQRPWNRELFTKSVDRLGNDADFIVLPDIVAGGRASLEVSRAWLSTLQGIAPLYVAVQDGMHGYLLDSMAGQIDGIFVGGSTSWKLRSLQHWGEQARRLRKRLHVGRVNTRRRIKLCHLAGADSFDGTSVSRFSQNIHKLDDEARQPALGLVCR